MRVPRNFFSIYLPAIRRRVVADVFLKMGARGAYVIDRDVSVLLVCFDLCSRLCKCGKNGVRGMLKMC